MKFSLTYYMFAKANWLFPFHYFMKLVEYYEMVFFLWFLYAFSPEIWQAEPVASSF